MSDDAALLQAYAGERSERAFAEVVQRHLALVYAVALRQVGGDRHLAEEVAHKVFTDLARKAGAAARHPALSAWLYRSTRFEAIDALRAERRRRQREQEAHLMQAAAHAGDQSVDAEKLRPVLDEVIGELRPADRALVMLRFFEEQPFAEIGRRLQISEDAARMRAERALEKLRTALERRGIGSTSVALSGILASQAGAAVPAGLAASVTGAVLSGAGAATSLGVAALFMSSTKFQIAAAISLAANALLLGLCVIRAPELIGNERGEVTSRPAFAATATFTQGRPAPSAETGAQLVLSAGDWQALASGDPKILLARLRAMGVPDDLARKATLAEIMARFVGRYREVYGLNERMPPFWTSYGSPRAYLNEAPRMLASQAYWRDFIRTVEDVLGPGAMYSEAMPESERSLMRETYGDLAPARMVRLLEMPLNFTPAQAEASARAAKGMSSSQDQAIFAEMQRDQQAKIEAILTPGERERLELRNSSLAAAVRQSLLALNPTEEEFRTTYAIRKQYEIEKGAEPAATAAPAVRSAWSQELNDRIAAALSPERAEEFRRRSVDAAAAAQLARLVTRLEQPFENVDRILALQQSAEQQSRAILTDRSLTPTLKTQRLEALAAQTTASVTTVLGGDPRTLEAYKLSGGAWISALVPRLIGATPR